MTVTARDDDNFVFFCGTILGAALGALVIGLLWWLL